MGITFIKVHNSNKDKGLLFTNMVDSFKLQITPKILHMGLHELYRLKVGILY